MEKITVRYEITSCRKCPHFNAENTGRESWDECRHPIYKDGAYGKVITGTTSIIQSWCPLK